MEVQLKPSSLPDFSIDPTAKFDIRRIYHRFTNHFPPRLRWISMYYDGAATAEVLLSAELIHMPVPNITSNLLRNESIPIEISPNISKFRLDVMFAGIRNASKLSQSSSGRYKIELAMGDLKLSSGFSGKTFKKNLNFLDPHASGYLLLPDQFQYWPSIVIKHLDCSHKHPFVLGAGTIRRPEMFHVSIKPKVMQKFLTNSMALDQEETVVEIEENQPLLGSNKKLTENVTSALQKWKFPKFLLFSGDVNEEPAATNDSEYTWWTKFYNSSREPEFRNEGIHQLKVIGYKSDSKILNLHLILDLQQ